MDQNKKPQRIDKENRVSILRDHFANSQAVILADYRGVNVGEDTKLRASMRKANITYMIAKNTLIKRAANEVLGDLLDPFLEGPTAIAFSEDPVVLAKVFGDFMKTNKKMELKAGALGNQLLDANGIEALAKLPSKEVLLGQVAGAFQAPMVAFAGCAVALLRQLVTVTDAVREQKAQEA